MALSYANSGSGGIPGLTLRAWALISSAGALIKGFNVASTSKSGGSSYLVTFITPFADTNAVLEFRAQVPLSTTQQWNAVNSSPGTAAWEFRTQLAGSDVQPPGAHWVAFYG